MSLDIKIKEKLELIQQRKDEINLIERGKTNTHLVVVVDGVSYNLNVLSIEQIAELALKMSRINEDKFISYELLELPEPEEVKFGDYSLTEWLEDMKTMCRRKDLIGKKQQLSLAEKELKKLYSEDAKREDKLNDVLGKLGDLDI